MIIRFTIEIKYNFKCKSIHYCNFNLRLELFSIHINLQFKLF